ncbi:YdcF family protein [Lichenihabitans sp. Uapishka_5]|uniref:YdcF family protein n=1 Tax=Lichenihabitans sp. Uapishka_5 TaxID=3037302 RepID=UPI0029E829B1|nr:YdcF family protein [Lichenihabitans sp. Uapishka_5]MDX7953330.1 YdcF family protein [Lichenihabitans sp. Uapishka_5]
MSRTRGLLVAVAATLALLGCGLLVGFLDFAAGLQGVEARPNRHADALVVLTGGTDRVSDAIDLLADGQAERLLITGVNPATTPESLARRLPRVRDLVACCVTLGYEALDTAGNAAETAAWVRANRIRSLIVVTSNYHMPRALAEIGHQLRDVDLRPYPVVTETAKLRPWWTSPHRSRLIATEYLKYVVVLARQALLPTPDVADPVMARDDVHDAASLSQAP